MAVARKTLALQRTLHQPLQIPSMMAIGPSTQVAVPAPPESTANRRTVGRPPKGSWGRLAYSWTKMALCSVSILPSSSFAVKRVGGRLFGPLKWR